MKKYFQSLKIIFEACIRMFFFLVSRLFFGGGIVFCFVVSKAKIVRGVGSFIFFSESSLMAGVLLQSRKMIIYFVRVMLFLYFCIANCQY